MKKRDTCVICGEKATCFYYYQDSYVPFCLEHYGLCTNATAIQNNVIQKEDFKEYLWRRK